jgi:alpha-N-acetylglucosamine transferase
VYRNRAILLLIVNIMVNNISQIVVILLALCQSTNLSFYPSTMTTAKEINHSIEPPRKKPKKSKGTSDTVVVKKEKDNEKNKAPNFHSDQDELLAMAWILASNNPMLDVDRSMLLFGQMQSTSPETKVSLCLESTDRLFLATQSSQRECF